MKKRLSSLLSLALALILVLPAYAAEVRFRDVPSNHWAYNSIECAADQKWVAGVTHSKYAPNEPVTVAQWTTMVTRMAYPEEVNKPAQKGQWYSYQWYAPYIEVGLKHGLDDYVPDPILTPQNVNRPTTRAEMACIASMVVSIFGGNISQEDFEATRARIPDINEMEDLGDKLSYNYSRGVIIAYHYGIICGVDSTGRFAGFNKMNRAQAATVLCRLHETVKKIKAENQSIPQPEPVPQQPAGNDGPLVQ